MFTLKLSPSGPPRRVGLPDVEGGTLGDAPASMPSEFHSRAIYTLAASVVTTTRTYTPADNGNPALVDDGDQITLQVNGALGFDINAGGAVIPAGGDANTRQFITWERRDGAWVIVNAAVTGASGGSGSAAATFSGALSGSPDGSETPLGFVAFTTTVLNETIDWSFYNKMDISNSTNVQRRVQLQQSDGTPIADLLDEITGANGITEWGAGDVCETVVLGTDTLAVAAGNYRLALSVVNGSGVADPFEGTIYVHTRGS